MFSGRVTAQHFSRIRYLWSTYDLGNCLVLIGLLSLLGLLELIPPHHRLIVSDTDPTMSYPLVTQQVSSWLLGFLVGVLPLCAIIAVYFIQRRFVRQARREMFLVLFGWALSMVITLIMTSFIKKVVGRPRPNFFALSGYQPDGTFTGSASDVSNAFQSFPSGHTSSAFSGLGYISLYFLKLALSSNFKTRESAQSYHVNQSWKTVVCLSPLILATWIGLTRIVDYWHGFDDVSIGGLVGGAICTVTFHLHTDWWWSSVHPPRAGDSSEDSDADGVCPVEDEENQNRPRLSEPTHYAELRTPDQNGLILQSPATDAALLDAQL